MTITHAIAQNIKTNATSFMNADGFDAWVKNNPKIRTEYSFIDIEDAAPLNFTQSFWRKGHEESVSAHFKRAKGYGHSDHVFDHEHKNISLKEAFDQGKKFLFSLNPDLSYRWVNFRETKGNSTQTLEGWINKNARNYVSVSIKNAKQAIQTVLKINAFDPDNKPQHRIYSLYRGGVLPFSQFFVGNRKDSLNQMFDDLISLKAGVKIGESRIIGTPRLVRFIPTQKALESAGTKLIRGNSFYSDTHDKIHGEQLIFSDENLDKKGDLTKIWDRLKASVKKPKAEQGVFVLASPSISLQRTTNGKGAAAQITYAPDEKWDYLCWIINDADKQITLPLSHAQPV